MKDMKYWKIKALCACRKVYRLIFKPNITNNYLFSRTDDFVEITGQKASDLIYDKIMTGAPLMIARYGEIEIRALGNVYTIRDNKTLLKKVVEFIQYKSLPFWWDKESMLALSNNAGVFPVNNEIIQHYFEVMLNAAEDVDILGSWQGKEVLFEKELKLAKRIKLRDIEPYYHECPWSRALKGKKVLVIHPFAETIEKQYQKHKVLYENKDVLPDFELTTLKAVQSIAGTQTEFLDWFEALESMKEKIKKIDFDIAILGCGAYGFVLASYIKKLGKQAIHMGGPTQILFGIKGKRWDDHPIISKFYNEHWVTPNNIEKPQGANKVENGCYW